MRKFIPNLDAFETDQQPQERATLKPEESAHIFAAVKTSARNTFDQPPSKPGLLAYARKKHYESSQQLSAGESSVKKPSAEDQHRLKDSEAEKPPENTLEEMRRLDEWKKKIALKRAANGPAKHSVMLPGNSTVRCELQQTSRAEVSEEQRRLQAWEEKVKRKRQNQSQPVKSPRLVTEELKFASEVPQGAPELSLKKSRKRLGRRKPLFGRGRSKDSCNKEARYRKEQHDKKQMQATDSNDSVSSLQMKVAAESNFTRNPSPTESRSFVARIQSEMMRAGRREEERLEKLNEQVTKEVAQGNLLTSPRLKTLEPLLQSNPKYSPEHSSESLRLVPGTAVPRRMQANNATRIPSFDLERDASAIEEEMRRKLEEDEKNLKSNDGSEDCTKWTRQQLQNMMEEAAEKEQERIKLQERLIQQQLESIRSPRNEST